MAQMIGNIALIACYLLIAFLMLAALSGAFCRPRVLYEPRGSFGSLVREAAR